jgi:hypothetical protein
MAAPPTFTPEQKAAMAELVNDRGLSLAATERTLAAGHNDLEPFKVSRETIAQTARKAKAAQATAIDGLELAEALDTLGRQSLVLIGRRLAQVDERPDKFDATEVLTIMRALTEAKGLVKAKGKGNDKAPTFLEAVGLEPTDASKHKAQSQDQAKQTGEVDGAVTVQAA